MKLCTGSTERKYFATAISFASAAILALGLIDKGPHVGLFLNASQSDAISTILVTVNVFFGVLMLLLALKPIPKESKV